MLKLLPPRRPPPRPPQCAQQFHHAPRTPENGDGKRGRLRLGEMPFSRKNARVLECGGGGGGGGCGAFILFMNTALDSDVSSRE